MLNIPEEIIWMVEMAQGIGLQVADEIGLTDEEKSQLETAIDYTFGHETTLRVQDALEEVRNRFDKELEI